MSERNFLKRMIGLLFGLYLFALGLTLIIHCGLGMDSWNVFHDGISKTIGIKLGYASVLVSIVMMAVSMASGEPLGIGTILNGTLVGVMVQFHIDMGIFTVQSNFIMGLLYLLGGMICIAFGSYFYMKQGFGSGPRDSFTLALSKKTGMKIGYVKSIVEVIAVILGVLLGGNFGLATVIGAIFTGIVMQFVFDIMKFNAKGVKHQNVKETIEELLS